MPQQRLHIGLAIAESDVQAHRFARTARHTHARATARRRRVEDITGLLEGLEAVGV